MALPAGRGTVKAEIAADGPVHLKLDGQGRIDKLEGEVSLNGQVGLALPQADGDSLEVGVSVDLVGRLLEGSE